MGRGQHEVAARSDGAPVCVLCGEVATVILTNELRDGSGRVFHCSQCDLGILEPPNESALQQFYDGDYRKKHGPVLGHESGCVEIFEAHVGVQEKRLDLLRPLIGSNARVLEVGCSTGHLLFHLDGRAAEAVGVDFDSAALQYAREQHGLTTYAGPLDQVPIEPRSFDLVCCVQMLEHTADPVWSARELSRYLKPGGKIFVEVPNLYDPLLALYDCPRYRSFYYHRAHLWYFSERSLAAVLEGAGFAGSIEFTQDYGLMNHLNWALLDGPQSTAQEGLGAARLPLAAGTPVALREDLDALMAETDARYKALLSRHRAAENLTFIGSLQRP